MSQTLEFIWDPAEVVTGIYTISVNASVVEGEEDPTDNSYTVGTIEVLESEAPPFPIPMELLIVIIVVVVIIVVAVVFLRRRKPAET